MKAINYFSRKIKIGSLFCISIFLLSASSCEQTEEDDSLGYESYGDGYGDLQNDPNYYDGLPEYGFNYKPPVEDKPSVSRNTYTPSVSPCSELSDVYHSHPAALSYHNMYRSSLTENAYSQATHGSNDPYFQSLIGFEQSSDNTIPLFIYKVRLSNSSSRCYHVQVFGRLSSDNKLTGLYYSIMAGSSNNSFKRVTNISSRIIDFIHLADSELKAALLEEDQDRLSDFDIRFVSEIKDHPICEEILDKWYPYLGITGLSF